MRVIVDRFSGFRGPLRGWFVGVASAAIFVGGGTVASAAPLSFTSAVLLQTPVDGFDMDLYDTNHVSAVSGAAGKSYMFLPNEGDRAVRWSSTGVGEPLGDSAAGQGFDSSYAYGINDSGQVVGVALVDVDERAIRWSATGEAMILGDVAGASGDSRATAISDNGQVAGDAGDRAARWSAAGVGEQLGDVAGQTIMSSFASAINDGGQVAGYTFLSGVGFRAVRWSEAGDAELLNDVSGQTTHWSYASDINASGQVVGRADLTGVGYRAVRWSEEGDAELLGDLPGQAFDDSYAYGINDDGQVAGYVDLGRFNELAVIWDADGSASLLSDLMDDGNTWTFTRAVSIDTSGSVTRVLAYGSMNGGGNAWYLLDAVVPEPAALSLMGLGAVALLRRARRG